jgi:hypothetical protein
MARKKWTPKAESTPQILLFREKRKWQIALRRYVLDRNPSVFYAPYFGLDIESLRKWFEVQFDDGIGWGDFAREWKFDHIVPMTYFDFSVEAELRLCWNFTNLRVQPIRKRQDREGNLDVLAAKGYFQVLFNSTNYSPCLKMLEKIEKIGSSALSNAEKQKDFILANQAYIFMVEDYGPFEFQLLNSGRDLEEVKKEIEFLRKLDK